MSKDDTDVVKKLIWNLLYKGSVFLSLKNNCESKLLSQSLLRILKRLWFSLLKNQENYLGNIKKKTKNYFPVEMSHTDIVESIEAAISHLESYEKIWKIKQLVAKYFDSELQSHLSFASDVWEFWQ